MNLKLIPIIVLLLCLSGGTVFGSVVGKITGEITDADTDQPVVGATVSVKDTDMGAVADQDGIYTVNNVPVGTYTLVITAVGYATVEISNVEVSADLASYHDMAMSSKAADIGKIIKVTAERPMVIKDKVASIQIVRDDELLAMPTRGFEDVVGIQSGVVAAIQSFRGGNRSRREFTNTPELFIRGGRPSEVAFYVDGHSQQDPLTGTSTGNISNNAIKEIAVISGGFPVEYGHVTSGIVNVITQSGGDKLSGTAEVVTDQVYDQNWYSATLGGPLPGIQNAFFFGSIERRYHRDRRPSAVTSDVLPGSPDRLPNNSLSGWSYSGKLDYSLNPNIKVALSGVASVDRFNRYQHTRLFENEHNQYFEDKNHGFVLKWTHTLDAKTFYNLSAGLHVTERFSGDGVHRKDIWEYGRPGGNSTSDAEALFRKWDDWMEGVFAEIDTITGDSVFFTATPTVRIVDTVVTDTGTANGVYWEDTTYYSFIHGDESQVYDDYLKRKSSYIGIKGDITKEMNREHTIKAGFELNRHSLRYYNHLRPVRLNQGYKQYGHINRYGYDEWGNESDDEGWRNEAKNPIDFALYLQDRIEYQGLIVTAGVRFDVFDYKGKRLRNADLPLDPDSLQFDTITTNDTQIQTLEEADLEDSETFTRVSPRLGIAFPISDRTQMRVSYGRFFQRPNLEDLYVGYQFMEFQLLGSGYYTDWGNPNLEPPKTTAYEVGMTHQLGDNTSFDVNIFYRDVSGLIQTIDQPSTPNSFGTFRNQDYGTIKGLEFNLKMRRTRNIMADLKYTLSYANGTGSFNSELRNVAWVKGIPPKHTAPLEFDQRHKLVGIFDLRFGKAQGPRLGDYYVLENFGINILTRAASGSPYTPAQIYNEPTTGSVSPIPNDVRNSSNRPWTFRVDLKMERAFEFGDYRIAPYLWVMNLLDRDNVINVWEGTGKANTAGYLETGAGQVFVDASSTPSDNLDLTGEEKYNIAQNSPSNYDIPRQILFGLRVSF
ncbi:MAG: TonB-dependent receptor [candidate division Zixibacteria bacterium]|nr:TonB-dependent receptor [candidate division Zixibacteria bacterium]